MNQFMVPQFIEVEDKIFGPVTSRQFVILLVGALACFIAFKLSDTVLFIVWLILIGGGSLILAFATINGQPFHFFILNILQNLTQPSRSVWNKYCTDSELRDYIKDALPEKEIDKTVLAKTVNHTRIRDLSLMVNTGGYYKGDE